MAHLINIRNKVEYLQRRMKLNFVYRVSDGSHKFTDQMSDLTVNTDTTTRGRTSNLSFSYASTLSMAICISSVI